MPKIKGLIADSGKTSLKFSDMSFLEMKRLLYRNPADNLKNQINQLKCLDKKLKTKIYGQDHAINEVVNAIKFSRAGFRNESKPVCNFLFVGPTGVGKTELPRQLAKLLDLRLLRYDMSEYSEKVSPTKLIGASPGYVGYEDGGILVKDVKDYPYSVVLLDEIEKAHTTIFNILLQVMDAGILTDNQGNKANFRNVILIMTSNAGAWEIGKKTIGFDDQIINDSVLDNAVKKTFSPEFRNRLDGIIKFDQLSLEIIKKIVRKEFESISSRLKRKNIKPNVSEWCIQKVADDSYSKEYGARNVSRFIEELVKKNLIDEILFGKLINGGSVNIDWRENRGYVFEIF